MGLEAPLVEQAECSSRAPSGTSDGSKARPRWCLQLLLPPSGRSFPLYVLINFPKPHYSEEQELLSMFSLGAERWSLLQREGRQGQGFCTQSQAWCLYGKVQKLSPCQLASQLEDTSVCKQCSTLTPIQLYTCHYFWPTGKCFALGSSKGGKGPPTVWEARSKSNKQV